MSVGHDNENKQFRTFHLRFNSLGISNQCDYFKKMCIKYNQTRKFKYTKDDQNKFLFIIFNYIFVMFVLQSHLFGSFFN